MRAPLGLILALLAGAAWAGQYQVESVHPLLAEGAGTSGQAGDPRPSPDGRHLSFEVLGAAGDTMETYVVTLAPGEGGAAGKPEPVVPTREADPFALPGQGGRPVSEHVTWAPPKRGKPRLAVAATRLAVARGATNVNFDLFLSEPGRRRFLTDHPENDAQPAFSPDGEFLAFTSGRSGQGDVYLYHFFAQADPYVQLTFEAAGSEFYPAWAPSGDRLAYVGHLGNEDHVYVIDGVRGLAAEADSERRRAEARRRTRDVTPGWKASCLAPSFSPDGRWLAFYAREGAAARADLYVVPTAGGPAHRLMERGVPETHGGPRWAPDVDGLFAVREDADRLNPLVWVPLDTTGEVQEIPTGTELNADPYPLADGDEVFLFFTAQGSSGRAEKRWHRLYVARLRPERGSR